MTRASGLLALVLLGCSLMSVAQSQTPSTLTVGTWGAVDHAGDAVYPPGARLSTVALAAGVHPDAYLLGAAWLQMDLKREQMRLHAGLNYELGALRRQAMAAGNDSLAAGAAAFQGWFQTLPITGRRADGVSLDPVRVSVTPAENWPVHDGDRLYYPSRPSGVRIVGAVVQPCTLPQVPMQDARRYLAACPVSPAADPNRIYVVQPDGAVSAQNTALWNRDLPRPLAPGAWIYVPFAERSLAPAADTSFNLDVARFLATQLVKDEVSP